KNSGAGFVESDSEMAYPRLCAHRGFSTIAPENSMPAFGAAVAMGAEEIEFDLWPTADGEIVSCHDGTLDRVSTGSGRLSDKTLDELLSYDFGIKHGERFIGMKIVQFEEILEKLAGRCIMNIHIKSDEEGIGARAATAAPYTEETLGKIVDLIRRYDCAEHVYFMTPNRVILGILRDLAPEMHRVVGFSGDPKDMIPEALEYDCTGIQLFKPYFDQAMVDEAHEKGLMCTVFWADDPDEAERYLDMGIETILTNDYEVVANRVNGRLRKKKR
ncbi:MAG: hypothetical protein IJX14_00640, partial [Clostridia bacterium]|nr:hypothetical protein [Clostridia bacterium]